MIAGFPFLAGRPLWSGLAAFYKLDGLTDSSGNGYTLTNNNGVTFSAGKIGNAANFDGTNWLSRAFPGSPVSVSLWIKDTEFTGFTNMVVFRNAGNNIAFLIQGIEGDNFRFFSGEDETQIESSITVADNNWHHIVVTIMNGIVYIYVDGTLNVSEAGGTSGVIATKIGIGSYEDGSYDLLDGSIDAVGIWNRPLTQPEVSLLYNNGTGREI